MYLAEDSAHGGVQQVETGRTLHLRAFVDCARELGIFFLQAVGIMAGAATLLLLLHFPYDSDLPLSAAEAAQARKFYAAAYDTQKSLTVSPEEDKYAKTALDAAERWHVKDQVADLARKSHLENKRVLDIGSGQGYLQDVVADYTGLDISSSVQRYYHKRFVLGSATAMPFGDNTFDSAWSVWVLEHVPNPEAALIEIRRVVKDGGILFLGPQWDCHPWQADGYDVRPYSDFGLPGKFIKAVLPLRFLSAGLSMPLVRSARATAWKLEGRPTKFRYHRLTPNFQTYWEADSDAVNSLDFYEMGLWFRSRGDECMTCEGGVRWLRQTGNPLVIRLHKRQGA